MSFLGGHALVLSMSQTNAPNPSTLKRSCEKSPSPRTIDYGNSLNCKSVIKPSFLLGPPNKVFVV